MTDNSNFKVKIFTIFPDLFPGILSTSIVGDALKKDIWNLQTVNIRDFAINSRGSVDDTPFGGGAGMLMRPDVLGSAIDSNIKDLSKTKIIYPSPRGKIFTQKMARELSLEKNLAIICGRYEGVDQRVIDEYDMQEISIGDYILSGGELAAMVIIDAIVRNLDGVLGAGDSLKEESFGDGQGGDFDNLLEYPHYTKPQIWKNRKVPDILLSGHHKNIQKWRKDQAIKITKDRRGDLLK
jgi:tRNA (guanine37-N1)-methyltransferase